jgi:hypothetical protein
MKRLLTILLLGACLLGANTQAMVVRGIGTAALVGHDLTDPQNDGDPDNNVNYNATFRSSAGPGFSGESAFNVFDNRVGGSSDKWCCNSGTVWVEADFGKQHYVLTSFTAASSNDTPARDSDFWRILGSNDGVNYTTIFEYNVDGVSAWTNRLQVNQYAAGSDFATPAAYSIFRYESFSTVGLTHNTSEHALSELEFFGTAAVPEPGSLALLVLGAATLAISRRRNKRG